MIAKLVAGSAGARTGFVLALLGTWFAVNPLFPVEPGPAGALRYSGIVLGLCLILVPVGRALSQTDVTNAENFVSVGYVFWLLLDIIQGAYDLDAAKPENLRLALMATGLSAAAMWIGTLFRPLRIPRWLVETINRPLDVRTASTAVPICFALGMFNFVYSVNFNIPEMFSYIGADRWSMPWGRTQLGGWGSFRDQAPYFGYVLPSLAAILIAKKGPLHGPSIFAVVCSAIMLLFLSTGGGRRIIAVAIGAALVVWIQLNPGLKLKNILIVSVSLVTLAWTAQFMLNIRSSGYESFVERGESEYDHLHVDDNFLRLAQVIEIVPQYHHFIGAQQVVFTLVRPIPRVLWPGKPISAGFDLPKAMGMRDVSLSTSIVGEWYIAWGWLSVIAGALLYGWMAQTANAIRDLGNQADNPMVYALSVMVLIAGMRSMQDLVLMSYAIVAWWVVSRFFATPQPVYATR